MAESEKVVALKKAYADIILNTAKEAAARIMVSERKAVNFQKDLNSSKDEALRLLLNLKQMIDSTTKEASVTSLTKKRKIDELEAQLNEAEDVITDLRSELVWVRDKLEKVRTNSMQPLNGQIVQEDTCFCENVKDGPIVPSILNRHHEAVTASDVENSPLDLRVLGNRCCSTRQQSENSSVSHFKLDDHAPNMRNQKPEPNRSGCTPRIHAVETTLAKGNLPQLSNKDGQSNPMKNEMMHETINKAVGKCPAASPKTKGVEVTKKLSLREVKKGIKVCSQSQRRKTRFGKAKASIHRSHLIQLKKSSVPSQSKTHSVNENVRFDVKAHDPSSIQAGNWDNVKFYSDWDEQLLQKGSLNEEEIRISQKGKENMGVKSGNSIATTIMPPPNQLIQPCQPSSVVNRGVIYSFTKCGNVKSREGGLSTADNEAKMKPLLRLDPGLTLIRSGVDPVSGSENVTVSVKALNKCWLVQKTEEKNTRLRSESAVEISYGGAVENSMDSSELGNKLVNTQPLSDSKDSKSSVDIDGWPSKPDCNRVLKYTFHRKRKKQAMSSSGENISPDKTMVKQRGTEKLNDSQEPKRSTLINKSLRDSRRMAQVARQLIALSGRRW